MRLRRLGRTGLAVSECCFGTAALRSAPRAGAGAALARAIGLGVNAIELDAGDGDAVDLVGEVLRRERAGHRVHVFARVSSPVRFDLPSPHVPADQAYPGRHIRAETEALLARLGVERLALQQLHAWCPEWLHEGDWRETLEALRGEGKIAGVGLSLFDHDVHAGLEAVASGAVDSVQVMVNLFDQGAAATLLPLCQRHDVGVIARAPLYYGALTDAGGLGRFAYDDWRGTYFYPAHRHETEARVAQLRGEGASVSELALRFALSHPAVSTVAVGMRDTAQVEANVQALGRGPLDAGTRASLVTHKWLC
ncbi:MAG: aldo/keto reductase [Sphingomonas sp.]|uniref:aldo/keto reductase n=1 Tax=Sphingomonas sp. TaxID=28214 RepID=UPI001B214327|nr:aldo/keto reductase [Sphingomonas sp.]MBO9624286.1 aldo/keto reductase [Sphingomonas sp.]